MKNIFYTIVLAVAILATGCRKEEVTTPVPTAKTGSLRVMAPSLIGKWTFTGYKNDQNVVSLRAVNKITLTITQQNTNNYIISGRGLVNSFSVNVDTTNPTQTLKANTGISTLMGGSQEDMTAESTFLLRLLKAKDATLLEDKLTIDLTDGEAMNFKFTQ